MERFYQKPRLGRICFIHRSRETKSSPIHWLIPQTLTTAETGPGCGWEFAAQSRCPVCVVGTQLLKSSPAAPQSPH